MYIYIYRIAKIFKILSREMNKLPYNHEFLFHKILSVTIYFDMNKRPKKLA